MKKKIMAVCDPEAAYVYRLLEFLNRQEELPFEVRAFTDAGKLKSFLGEQSIAVLLADEHILEDWMKEKDIKVIILSEGSFFAEWQEYPSVYKYQSSEDILREVMCYYGDVVQTEPALPGVKQGTELIGIYSPVRRTGRTTFAVTLGQVLAENRRVLYLNMEEYSGFAQLLGREVKADLADLMYFVRKGNGQINHRLNQMACELGALDYIPPAAFPADLKSVTYDEWEYLLQVIEEQSLYETVILDMGDHIQKVFDLLGLCKRIYSPVLKDTVSKAKWMQYEYMLGMSNKESLLKRTRKLMLPRQKPHSLDELGASPLAGYVRTLLEEEK